MFNSREIAVAIWTVVGLVVFLVLTLPNENGRRLLLGIIRILFDRRILTWVGLMLLYTAGMVWLLYVTNLWNISLLKDTIVWFCFTGIVLAVSSATRHYDGESIAYDLGADSFKVVVLFELLINAYTFPLYVEIFLVPIATLVVLLGDVAQTMGEEYAPVATLTSSLQVIIGFSVLIYAVIRAISEFHGIWTISTFHSVILAPLLSLLFMPFIYLMLVFMEYESLFVRLRTGPDRQKDVQRYAKRQLIMHLGLKLAKIQAFRRAHLLHLMRIQTRDDVDRLLDEMRGPGPLL